MELLNKRDIAKPLHQATEQEINVLPSAHSEMGQRLARFILTGTARAIDALTSPQRETMSQFERDSLMARESGNFSSISQFVLGLSMSYFDSFSLATPVAKQVLLKSRNDIFGSVA